MHVLYVDPDPHVRQTVKKGLEAAGVEIVALGETRQALAHLGAAPVDVVVCAVEPGGSEGATFLSGAQSRLGATPLVIVSAFYTADDPELAPMFVLGQAAGFLAKPFAVAELARTLRAVVERAAPARPAPPRPAPTGPSTLHGLGPRPAPQGPSTLHGLGPRPAPQGPSTLHGAAPRRQVDPRNLSLLTRLWATRATGTLRVAHGASGVDGWASLSRGGSTDPESTRLISTALIGGELVFEPGAVDSIGDWEAMADLLWRAARDPTQRSFALENRFQALSKTQWSGLLMSLPLAPATRRLLANINPTSTLGEAIARSGVDDELVSPDLYALSRMRIVAMGAPLPAAGADAAHGIEQGGAARRAEGSGPTSTPPSSTPRSTSRSAGGPSVGAPVGGGHSGLATLPGSRAGGSVTTRSAYSSRVGASAPPRASGPHSTTSLTPGSMGRTRSSAGIRGAPTSAGSGVTSTAANARARDRINTVLRYLRGEVNNLGSAPPAVLLGVPVDASNELMLEASQRLRARYQGMIDDPALDAEAHKLATQMLERVDEAARNFGKARSAAAAGTMDEERLLTMARELIAARQWDQAERVLTRARQLKADHVGVLANLGWARLHNPVRGASERATAAEEMLALAEQFDPQHAEGQYYLAELLYRLGEYARALPRAERAERAAPENPAAASLARKLRNRLNPGSR